MRNDYTQGVRMSMMLSAVMGAVLVALPAEAQLAGSHDEVLMRTDNRGPGSLNSGPGSMHSGRDASGERGRREGDDLRVVRAGDVRQEDRQQDRREDRQVDRQQDRREDRRSTSAGGEVRGLDRADQVAGDRGQQGRDNARDVQSMRATRPERVERLQRPERLDRPERVERSERPERMERSGRN